jgi:hypothetical protein
MTNCLIGTILNYDWFESVTTTILSLSTLLLFNLDVSPNENV